MRRVVIWGLAAATLCAAALATTTIKRNGAHAMGGKAAELGWQWRAGRPLAQRAVIAVQDVRKEGGGLFGARNAPSLAGALPDPMIVKASVEMVDRGGGLAAGDRISFRIPKVDLRGTAKGERVAIGLIDDKVVGLAPVPGGVEGDAALSWLSAHTFD